MGRTYLGFVFKINDLRLSLETMICSINLAGRGQGGVEAMGALMAALNTVCLVAGPQEKLYYIFASIAKS